MINHQSFLNSRPEILTRLGGGFHLDGAREQDVVFQVDVLEEVRLEGYRRILRRDGPRDRRSLGQHCSDHIESPFSGKVFAVRYGDLPFT